MYGLSRQHPRGHAAYRADIGGALVEWLEACPVPLDGEIRAGILAMIKAAELWKSP